MKKFLTVLCMTACLFGLTACGSQKNPSEATVSRIQGAETLANSLTQYMTTFFDEATADGYADYYSADAIEYTLEKNYSIYVDGKGMLDGIKSFNKGYDKFGDLILADEASQIVSNNITSSVNGKDIVVRVGVTGSKNSGVVKYIFSNDYFITMKSCELIVDNSLEAKLDQVGLSIRLCEKIGICIGILLVALAILIFSLKKKKKVSTKVIANQHEETINNAISHIIANEELVDDLELVAVITAAIAAYTGSEVSSESVEGFVVRSIRKARRTR